MNDEQFINALQDNYNRLFNYTGGQDTQLMISIASKYTLAQKQFSGVVLQKVIEEIQGNVEPELPLRLGTVTDYKLVFHLLQQEDRIQETKRIVVNNQALGEVNFKKTIYRIVGALYLNQSNNLEHAKRAKQLYEEMNRNQRFLTSKEDIPYVVFLTANSKMQPKVQAATILSYYGGLRNNKFKMGNHLQALAQIMTFYSEDFNKLLLQYVVKLRAELIERGVKVKKMHYPYLGVLALATMDNLKMDELTSLHNKLMELKIFKNGKEYALVAAIQRTVQDLELGPFVPTGISDVIDFFN